ncbi:MAG: DUF6364 family protein [Coriobacteriia bacterium]|nr:DUF6364 family protein [Coriobacteriia bacterium]
MNTKLTLRMDDSVIRGAKRYSAKAGKSVSQLVEDYLAVLSREAGSSEDTLPAVVKSLYGALAGSGVSEQDWYAHLEEKHR